MTVYADRLAALRLRIADLNLDAMLVEQPANRRYLTGFSGSSGITMVTPDAAFLITDSRYYGRAEREAPDFELVKAGVTPLDHLVTTLAEVGAQRIGIEAEWVTIDYRDRLAKKLDGGQELVPTTGVMTGLRAIKGAEEIAVIARAAALTDLGMAHAYETARPGMTERDLAWQLEIFLRDRGAEGTAFGFIVAGGPNGALPHHEPGDRPLTVGEPIVIDMGARMEGYCADLTRTFCIGEPLDADYSTVWDLVVLANQTAADQIKPGMTGKEADALARDLIAAAGYGDDFGHGLGHGVGLEIHELPRLGPGAADITLAPGMVITIEPGVYLPDRFGVRIEDLGVVRADGVELLSKVPKRATIGRDS